MCNRGIQTKGKVAVKQVSGTSEWEPQVRISSELQPSCLAYEGNGHWGDLYGSCQLPRNAAFQTATFPWLPVNVYVHACMLICSFPPLYQL